MNTQTPSPSIREETLARREALFRDARSVMASDLAAPLTVEEVAQRVATSPRQLQRAFAEVAGTSFRECLRRLRMAQAARLLASGEYTVRDAAAAVGYRAPGQFSKAFVRTFGFSPNDYRRRNGRTSDPRGGQGSETCSGTPN